MGLFLRKIYLLRCLTFSSKLYWALTFSLLLKPPLWKLMLWFVLWSFFLLRLLCISWNLWYGHAWNTVVMFGAVLLVANLELLHKLQKRICRAVVLSPAASLKLLVHCWNVACWSLFYRCYFVRCSSELAQLVPFPYFRERSTRYSYRFRDFFVTIPRCYKNVYINSCIPPTARLWNSLPIEWLPLAYDLNG